MKGVYSSPDAIHGYTTEKAGVFASYYCAFIGVDAGSVST
jgi:hypothetical protein